MMILLSTKSSNFKIRILCPFSDLGFDLAFGGYSDVDPRMGKIIAERLTA